MYLKMHCLLLAILHPVLLLKCTDTSRDAGSLIFLILLFYTENHCPCHVQSSEHALGVICSSILHQHNLRSPKSWYGDLYLQFFQSTGCHFWASVTSWPQGTSSRSRYCLCSLLKYSGAMIPHRWDENSWWLNFRFTKAHHVEFIDALCYLHQDSKSLIHHNICQNKLLLSLSPKLNELCVNWISSVHHSGFDLVVASLKLSHQNVAPGVCFVVKETVLKKGLSCLANPRLGYKHPFHSEHQLLGLSELEPRKRNRCCLEWSEVIYWHYEFLLCFLFRNSLFKHSQ